MNEGKTDISRQTVSSIGNAWLVANSKSHPGHVYYFNTLTGNAVWNLSEVEIERARLRTKVLERQHGVKPTKCPEPIGNPPTQQDLSKRQFNKQHAFEDQQTNICQQPGINIFQTQQSSSSAYSEGPVNNISPFDLNVLNNQLNAFNLITSPAVYNSQAAYIPRTQQFFITPAMPVVNQAQASLNIAYNQLMENDKAPAMRFNNVQTRRNTWNRFYKRKSNFKRGVNRKLKSRVVDMDLREKISLRKRLNNNTFQEQNWIDDGSSVDSKSASVCSHVADEEAIKDDDITEQNVVEVEEDNYEELYCNTNQSAVVTNNKKNNESSSKIDVSKLKCPEHIDVKLDDWDIVIDLNVLLEEFTVLCLILESDEHCKLVIPESVMTELKEFIASSNNVPARLIFHSLSKLIEDGNACVAEIPGQDYSDTITNPILNTCFELLEKNHHVILITKNNELLKYKKFIKISIYTMDDVKSLLEIDPSQHQSKVASNSIPQLFSKKGRPFHATRLTNIGLRRKSATVTQDPSNVQSTSETQKLRRESSRISEIITTTDAAIQTDKVTVISNNENKQVDIIYKDNVDSSQSTKSRETLNTSQTFNLSTSVKQRAIKLKRSTSNQPPTTRSLVNTIEKKPFRWRRRRTSNEKNSKFDSDDPALNSEEVTNVDSFLANECKNTQMKLKCHANEQIPNNNDEQILNVSTANMENVTKINSVDDKLDSNDLRDINSSVSEISNSYNTSLDLEKNPKESSVDTNLGSSVLDLQIDQEQVSNNKNYPTSNLEYMTESRESSVVCVNIRNENIIIEESSTSGKISNSESNIESDFSECKLIPDEVSCNEIIKRIVMYEVENESMEESLKTKCEEWVSRFMQIMEEALSIILHKDSIFSKTTLPPPWTLHEAAQCIRKYSNDAAVKHITDKLSRLLFDLSDDAGKINMNMEPCQYMTMYSYGISLLKAIKDNLADCEDIEIAENSLHNLLNDIKNPYCSSTGSDVDPQDISIVLSNDETHFKNDGTDEKLQDGSSIWPTQAQENCNFRSDSTKTKTVPEISPPSVQKKVDNEKSNIFSNINLKNIKRQINNTGAKKDTLDTDAFIENNNLQSHVTFSSDINKDIVSEILLNEPCVVRKFVICPKFEEKLKNISVDDEVLEYDIEYSSNNAISYDNCDLAIDSNDIGILNKSHTDIPQDEITSAPETVHPSDYNNILFKIMMKTFLQEVRNTLNDVKILCDSCYKELGNPQLITGDRCELQRRAEYAQSHVDNLCIALNGMWDRDKNRPGGHIHNALEKAGINILHVDEHLLQDYGNTIDICKNQAEVFLHSIREIIAGFKSLR